MRSHAENEVNNQLESFIQRIERLEEEKQNIMADQKEVFAEAKATGFEPKYMRRIIKERAMDPDDLDHERAMLDVYRDQCRVQK
jgi:uncharacterized protein (UPF0335 family)